MTALVVVFVANAALVAWVYFGYPALLAVVARIAPAPRVRAPVALPVSVIIAAYNEEDVIAAKIANVFASKYGGPLEVIVASDGSTDRTAERARSSGRAQVIELPRVGKIRALSSAAAAASGDVLVFTDADSVLEQSSLAELLSNFADPAVGGASANQVTISRTQDAGVVRGEGLYWRYEHWIKKLEDRVGNTVSAAGGLYAVRRDLFRPPTVLAGADDFLISTEVVRRGARLVFDEHARVAIESVENSAVALRRKVRVINGGLRGAFSLGRMLVPFVGGFYGFQVLTHKILRRFTLFFLVLALCASTALAAADYGAWLVVVAAQAAFYALAAVGWIGRERTWGRRKAFFVPYFFCLANVAAALAVLSLGRGVRFERWEPARAEAA